MLKIATVVLMIQSVVYPRSHPPPWSPPPLTCGNGPLPGSRSRQGPDLARVLVKGAPALAGAARPQLEQTVGSSGQDLQDWDRV